PTTESVEYVESIKRDVQWLGYQWDGEVKYTSDYFTKLYDMALDLIQKGLAYVDDSSTEEISSQKGDTNTPGIESPYRNRSVDENLELFKKMKAGEFEEGSKVLRAKIDMAHPNLNMRDPVIYRLKFATHHRTGDKWCIYPMYDFAHGQSDSIEEITHSLCTLEFENHRPLYNWLIEKLEIYPSRQIEFSRLNLTYTIMSKRKLLKLVNDNFVEGWDDPRMPTISGMRRRGYPASAIRRFAHEVGVTKRIQYVDLSRLEDAVRKELNQTAERVMAVVDPVKLIITNYPEGKMEMLEMVNNPEDENSKTHEMPFGRELYMERADFMVDPPKKFFRMAPGRNVRLKGAFIVHCEDYKMGDDGKVKEIYATYYPESRSGQDNSGIKAKGTLHWVSAESAVDGTVIQYDRLFSEEFPDQQEGKEFTDFYNHESKKIVQEVKLEPYLKNAEKSISYQFLRLGYFCLDDRVEKGELIFNRTVSLRDQWKKKKP
ncbi:MAG TPA: glutamine--tRNA ligase, partial [Saprospiraceae bacterium]|nr:glutamine--tRNA ligase [Saprospiraceae bacterium]